MPDLLSVATIAVIVVMLPAAVRDIRRGIRAARFVWRSRHE